MPDVIEFYLAGELNGEFSNFAPFPIKLGGKRWPTSEHYFQAQKFAGTPHEEEIRRVKKPRLAAEMGRDRKRPLRRDWEAVKERVMLDALRAKFNQHDDLRALLLATGNARLVEHTANDAYWGDGGDGSGKNRLGYLLMQLREELRNA
ncbi:NADAR family protein [Nannocystis bainbridge]|uniref:NADAR domain-containing protein n=1 Tax=Nannocystis bainbridge TaxID=2995303 RepID=A0ABT5DTB7_9BACT|nr:NADAR domain-containing protein [Nannocystis bainbridge]MDC0716383.1 NADAR domain-containing protein [Nannocystis bainbridge]